MKRSSLAITIVGSALLMGGAMFTAPQVTANPSLLYLAAQAKMALGDTAGGLQLLSRAAHERESAQMPIPQAKPKPTMASKACSDRSAIKTVQPTVMAKAEPKTLEKKMILVKVSRPAMDPAALLAKVSFPADPFGGRQDVPGMTREQIARVTAEYQQQIQRWTEEQRAHRFEIAQLQRLPVKVPDATKMRHAPYVRVTAPEPPAINEYPPEPPRTNP